MSYPRIRRLHPGEMPPEGVVPGRYRSGAGYIRLRWKIGPDEFVECYEHRWLTGAGPNQQVHHINGVKDDNRIENLKVVTPQQHRREHALFDVGEMERLYRAGSSTVQIGERLGCDPAHVSRTLRAHGVVMRSTSEALTLDLPEDKIRRLHAAGVRSRRIAAAFGVSGGVIDHRFRQLGLRPHRTGRPSDSEAARQLAALSEVMP